MQIDFYILETASGQTSLLFACRLLEKLYRQQQRIYVHTHSHNEAERLDKLLWTYRDDSFLPHQLYQAEQDNPAPIQIGFQKAPPNPPQVLLNLSTEIPSFFSQFQHIIEIVFADPPVQQLARQRYKQYREQGLEISTHKLKADEA
jgi:DNA polymerase-3 subunit chi